MIVFHDGVPFIDDLNIELYQSVFNNDSLTPY